MIEPNIEDRMARIASGSVGGNPIDPDVSSILNRPATESMPAMTQTVEPSGTDPDVSDIVGRSNPIPLMSSLMSARQVDPAQAARAQTLGQQLGIGQDIALRNMGSVEDRAFMAEINRRDIAVANPAVANLLAQRDFANLAHNDIDNLVETERFWKQASGQSAISDSWLNQAVDWMTPDVVKASLTTGYARAAAQDEIKPMATAVYKRLLSGGTAEGLSDSEEQQLRVRYRELNALQQSISGLESKASGWLTEPTYFASQMAMSLPNVARYAEMGAIVGGGIGAVGGVGILDWATIPVGMAAGATAGATTGFYMDSFESNAGEIYFQLRDKGYSRDQSYYTALTSGALIAAIDVGALKYASRFTGSAVSKVFGNAVVSKTMERFGLRAAEKAVAETTAEAAKRTFGRVVAETGLEAAKATLAEAGGETLQDMVQYAAEVAAYNLTPEEMRKALESPESLADAASGWVDTFLKTAQGTWAFQIPGMAAHVTHARKQLRQAQRSAALIDRVATLSDSSKLKQTSPQAYETAIETLAQGSGAETIYVDGGVARNMLMQANISGEQLDAIVPGLATQISEAAELGADVQIPISKFASSMAGTPIDSALRPYMRLSPSERTATEMQFESQLIRAMVEETEDASAAKIAKTREFAESAGKVQQKVFADLWNTGRYSRENARTNAVLATRWYSTMAGRMGMTPGQLYEQLPYRTIRDTSELPPVVSPMAMAALAPEQSATLTATVDATEEALKSEGFTNVSEERFQFIKDRIAGVRKAVKNNNVRDLESEAAMIREDIQKRGANAPMEKLAADVEARVREAKQRQTSTTQTLETAPQRPTINGVQIPARPEGMSDNDYYKLIQDHLFELPPMEDVSIAEINAAANAAQTAIDNSELSDKEKRQQSDSISRVASAIKRRNFNDLASALFKLNQRIATLATVPAQLTELKTKIERVLASAGITIEDPGSGIEWKPRGDVMPKAWLPARKDSTQQIDIQTAVEPIIRRNGELIKQGTVHIQEGIGSEEARQERQSILADEQEKLTAATAKKIRAAIEAEKRGVQTRPGTTAAIGRRFATEQIGGVLLNIDTAQLGLGEAIESNEITEQRGDALREQLNRLRAATQTAAQTGNTSDLRSEVDRLKADIQSQGTLASGDLERIISEAESVIDTPPGLQTPKILEQAARDIIANVDIELGSIMDAAKEASRLAGKTKSKDTQAAAFKAKQDWIASNPERYSEYQKAQRMAALENQRIREAAASALVDKIDASIATATKMLADAGFMLDYESPAPSKSKYYRKGNVLIRLSDHEIPVTPERAAAREAGIQVPYRDFVFDGTNIDAELLQDLESFAARATPNILEQAADTGARGGFDPSRLTTILNQKSDLSTWLHETAHFFMTAMSQLAVQPNATAEIRADMDEVLKWYGIAGATPEQRLSNWNAMSVDGQRKYHEQWAYNFEIYLSEGKAPSIELQGVFDRFAAWLRGVYKSIRDDLNAIYRREFGSDLPILTSEVRQVMDRMLATEEQIKLAREVNMAKALFVGRPEGMSDAEWAAYQAMAEEDENAAIASMTQASMKSMEWLSGARSRLLKELQLKHDKTRKEVRDRLSKQARMEPVYRALAFFKTGKLENPDGTVVTSEKGYRLNKAGVMAILDAQQAMTGAPGKEVMLPTFIDPLKLPKGIMAEDGMDPAMAAEMLGFPSANQMLLAIANAKPLAEEVDARTDAEMVRTHSELATPEGREKEVQKALHVETRERMIGVELRFLAKATQPVRVFVEAAKRAAQEILGRRLVKDVNPSEFVAAEARAAREAGMSLESLQTAQEASERAYKGEYAKQVAEGADAATADLRASGKARQAESEAQQRIDQFKAKYGNATPDQITIRATRQRLLQNQLAKLAISVRDEIDDGVRYMRKVMRDKNVKAMGADAADQIAGLLAAVDIRPMTLAESNRKAAFAKWLQSRVDDGIQPDIDEELMAKLLREGGAKTPYRNLTLDQFRELVSAIEQIEYIGKNENKILAAKRKADFQAELDVINNNIRANAGKRKVLARQANTPMQAAKKKVVRFHASMLTAQTVVRILDGGRDGGPLWNYLVRPMNEAGDRRTELVADATKKLTAIIKPFLNTGAMTAQPLEFSGINRPLTLENRFVLALNMGNAGNIQRLLDGEGWTMDTIRPVLESLTEDQLYAVQEVWNFLETYRPMFAERERRLIGREPQWVEPQALTVKTADGKEVTLKGGYYPAEYDPEASPIAENLDAQRQAEQQMSSARMTPATQNSGLKKRAKKVGKGHPLTLKLNALYSRVDEMVHDLCYREVIIDANRLMNSSFNNTVRETYGPEYVRVLKDYIADVAVGERIPNDGMDMLMNFIRRGKSAASLGLNIFNTIQNLTGISNSWERIGGKWLLNGTMQFAAHPLTMIERVCEKSSLMKNRGRTSLMNLNEIRNMVEGQSSTMRQMEIATYFLQQQTQRVVDMCTWLGQYTKGLAEGHTEEQAVAMADQAVIDSQGSGMVKDLPSAMRGPGKKKILSMFYGFFNSTYNLLAAKHMTNKNLGELAATYFRVIIVPATISYILKQLLTPSIADDDKDAEQIAKELAAENLAYLMNTVLGVREFAQLSRTVFDAEDRPITYGGPVSFGAINDGYRLIQQMTQGELDAAFRRSMLNVLGWGTGIPATQMNRTIDGITALYEGETTSPLAPVFGVRKH